MSFFSSPLKDIDNEIHKAINLELDRQQNQIELIASENIVSKAVLEAQGYLLPTYLLHAEEAELKRLAGHLQPTHALQELLEALATY